MTPDPDDQPGADLALCGPCYDFSNVVHCGRASYDLACGGRLYPRSQCSPPCLEWISLKTWDSGMGTTTWNPGLRPLHSAHEEKRERAWDCLSLRVSQRLFTFTRTRPLELDQCLNWLCPAACLPDFPQAGTRQASAGLPGLEAGLRYLNRREVQHKAPSRAYAPPGCFLELNVEEF